MTDTSNADADDGGAVEAPTKTFTQDEVNRMVARETVKARKEFSDYGELKIAAQRLAQIEESAKSEEQRLKDRASQADARAEQSDIRRRASVMRVAIIAEAARHGFSDPEDAVKMIDHTELTITDDDHVDGVKEAISLLLANKPYLVDGRRRGGSELRGQLRQGNSNEITRSKIRAWMHNEDGGMTPERMKLIEEAQRAGKIDVAR